MKAENRIIALAVVLALAVWLVDAVFQSLYFHEKLFWELSIDEIAARDIYLRLVAVVSILAVGVMASRLFREFRRADEKLRENEHRMRVVLQNTRDIVYKFDLKNNSFEYVSPSVLERAGFTPEEFMTMGYEGVGDRLHPEDLKRVLTHFQETLEGVLVPAIEFRWKDKDGVYRWFSDNRTVVHDEDGCPVALVGAVRDITWQKEAEQALRESEARYREIASSIPGVVYQTVFRPDGSVSIPFLSEAAYRLLELTPEQGEVDASPLFGMVLPEDFERVRGSLEESGRRMTTHTAEFRVKTRGGQVRWFRAVSSPHLLPDGSLHWNGVALDVTEGKHMDEALRKERSTLSKMIELNPYSISIYSPEGHYLRGNQAFLGLFQAAPPPGYSLFEDPILKRSGFLEVVRRLRKGEVVRLPELWYNPRDIGADLPDRPVFLRGTAFPIIRDGEVEFIVAIHEDVTERQKAEESLRESEERYRELADSIGDVFFAMDRDLKYTYWNSASERLTGIKSEEAIGKSLYDLFPDTKGTQVEQFYLRAMNQHQPQVFEHHYQVRGRDYIFEITAYPSKEGLSVFVKDITQRKKAEEALKTSEERYRLLIENATEGIVVAQEGWAKFVNPRAQSITGYPREQLLSKPFIEFVHPEDRAMVSDYHRKRLKGEPAPGSYEVRIIAKEGDTRWLEIAGVLITWEGRTASLNFVNDITERKKAEEALRASEERYRLLVENATEGIVVAQDGWLRFVNPRVEAFSGYSREELFSKPFIEFVHPQDREMVADHHQKRMRGESTPVTYDLRLIGKDGKISWLEAGGVGITWAGRPASLNFLNDITDRKRVEEAIRESEAKFRGITEYSSVGIAISQEGKISYANKRFADIFGYQVEELFGLGVLEIAAPEDRAMISERAQKRLKQEEVPNSYEFRGLKKDGAKIDIEVSSGPPLEIGGVPSILAVMQDISERKRAEMALCESEKKYRTLVETAHEGIGITSLEEDILFVNNGFASMLGYEPSEMVGRNLREFVTEEQYQTFQMETRARQKGVSSRYEIEMRHGDGSYRSLLLSACPLLDNEGNYQGTLGMIMDISERKKAEEALRESEEKFRNLAEQSPSMIFINKKGGVVYANRKCEEITGYGREEFYSPDFDFLTLIAPEFRDLIGSNLSRHLSGEEVDPGEYALVTKEGKRIEVILTSKLITYEGESAILGTVTDITERKRAEEAVRRSEEQLRAIFEAAADVIFTKDWEGRYTRVNSAFARLHRISEEDMIGRTDFDLLPEEYSRQSADLDRHVLVEGRVFTGERQIPIAGKNRIFHIAQTPLHGPDGAIIGLCGIARDITEQRSLEEQLRQSQKMESLGTLAGGVAHDFNNLLGGILGYASLLRAEHSPEDEHYSILELIEKAGMRAAELTNQLLAFSRKGRYELHSVNLNSSVETVLKLIRRTLDKRIEILTHLQEALPPVEGDSGQIEQAILNLCVNAAEAMPAGGKLELGTKVVPLGEEFTSKYPGSRPGEHLLLSVSDTGMGMDSETLSRIFEPFFTTKEVGKGTGLGLSTVYGIIKNHGGQVEVRSQPGEGTTFHLYFPVSEKGFIPPHPPVAEMRTGRETILAVDDEEIIRSLLKEALAKLGYRVLVAKDGREAIEIYDQNGDEIDGVIIDMIMPEIGGGETFQELKRRNPEVKVLLASGYSQDGAAQEILAEGVRGFIQKPFDLVELSQKLREVLDSENLPQ